MKAAAVAGRPSHVAQDPALLVVPPLRKDVEATPQKYLGRSYVIYKNPISLAYFRLPAAHAEAVALFDGHTTLADLAGRLAQSSRYWRALSREQALAELSALAGQMGQSGLLRIRGASASERGKRLRALKKSRRFETTVGHVLFFKKSLFDPDRLLGRLLPAVAWVYQPGVLAIGAVFVLISLCAALWNIEKLVEQGANFFTLSNLGLTWVLFLGVKVLHEFGHGLTAKRYGAEVHEMGFMFILFTPYLFCNVSDAWRAGKSARIAVGAAGLVVELFLASCAVWLWLFSQPGLFHQMCFNTIMLCSVSTILFNGNPLMKFDGYYILSDVLEIPNLRAKSNAWVTAWAQKHLLGLAPKTAPSASHEMSPLFGIYAVAAYCYGWFIVFSISVKAFDLLKPYGLEFISRTYVGLFLFVSLALPLYRLGRSVKGSSELRMILLRRGRWLVFALFAAGGALFMVPVTETVKRSAALEHARVEQVSAAAPGVLRDIAVRQGDEVREGQQLARLENRDLEYQLSSLKMQREMIMVRLRAVSAEGSEEARLTMPVLARQVRETDEEIAGAESKAASLELRAPRSGVLRTPHPQELEGRYFPARVPIFAIGGADEPRVLIALDEKEARKVHPGQSVRVIFTGLPGEVFHGQITSAPVSPVAEFSSSCFANLLGGDVPSEPSPTHGKLVPSLPHFEAEARIEISPEKLAVLRAQSSGRARIEVRRTNLAGWLRDKVYEAINPQVRL